MKMEELVFNYPSTNNVAWENITDKDWNILCKYREDYESLYEQMSLDEQFMFLCFVVQSENRPVLF